MMRISQPRARSATGSVPATSASPPVFANGTTSGEAKSTLYIELPPEFSVTRDSCFGVRDFFYFSLFSFYLFAALTLAQASPLYPSLSPFTFCIPLAALSHSLIFFYSFTHTSAPQSDSCAMLCGLDRGRKKSPPQQQKEMTR